MQSYGEHYKWCTRYPYQGEWVVFQQAIWVLERKINNITVAERSRPVDQAVPHRRLMSNLMHMVFMVIFSAGLIHSSWDVNSEWSLTVWSPHGKQFSAVFHRAAFWAPSFSGFTSTTLSTTLAVLHTCLPMTWNFSMESLKMLIWHVYSLTFVRLIHGQTTGCWNSMLRNARSWQSANIIIIDLQARLIIYLLADLTINSKWYLKRRILIGVVFDSNLQFDNHILGKVKTANRILGLIKRCFKNLDSNSFLLLYKALVRSHLEYAQTVWSPYKVKSIEALEGVQRRATKILPGFGKLT